MKFLFGDKNIKLFNYTIGKILIFHFDSLIIFWKFEHRCLLLLNKFICDNSSTLYNLFDFLILYHKIIKHFNYLNR